MTQKRNRKVGRALIILTVLSFTLVVARLSWLYVSEGIIDPAYRDPKVVSEYYRGSIYDRSGNILAMDSVVYVIEIDKLGLPGISKTASLIAPFTSLSAVEIENLLSDTSTSKLEINSSMGRKRTEDFDHLMEKENLSSYIKVRRAVERVYPLGSQGRHVIGRCEDGIGAWGAEKMFNDMLLPPMIMQSGIVKGNDVTLALDSDIEYLTYINAQSTRTEGVPSLSAVLSRDRGEMLGLTVYGKVDEDDAAAIMREAIGGKPISLVPRVDDLPEFDETDREFRAGELDAMIIYRDGSIMITASPDPEKAALMMENLTRMAESRGLIRSGS